MSSWRSKPRKNKIRKGAAFDAKTPRIVARLLATGFTYEDVGFILGVSQYTIQSWQQRYPIFKKEIEKAREAVKSITLAQMLKAAWGYDFVEKTITKDSKGNVTREKEVTKHQPANADLLKFIIINKTDDYKDVRRIDVTSKNANLSFAGELEEDAINELVGSLIKKIESKEVKKELDGKSEDSNTGTVFENNSKESGGKYRISENTSQSDS